MKGDGFIEAGCGQVDPESLDDSLAAGGFTALAKALAELTPELFTAETGIEVNYVILEEQTLREIVTRDVGAGGQQFDVVMIGMFEAPQFGRNGWLVDLNEYAEGDEGYMLDDIIPAVRDGRVLKSTIPHRRPSGISGFVMNTRLPVFSDWRVREAMTLAFNFELINGTLNNGTDPRITSYFSNSVLGMLPGPASGRVASPVSVWGGRTSITVTFILRNSRRIASVAAAAAAFDAE